jgi:RNA polymerase sigma-70 factor (ECF subfamily)
VHDDEADLVRRLRAGDEAAFATLVRRYQAPLVRLASTFVSNRAVAEEAVQETWLGVVRGIERFEGRASIRTWLFRILVNQARTAGVREHRSIPLDLGDEAAVPVERFDHAGEWGTPPGPWTDEVDARLDAKVLAGRLRDLMPGLPAAQRQVFTLRDIEHMSADEVCDVLDLTEGNQRVLLHRARSRLRGMLEAEMGKV